MGNQRHRCHDRCLRAIKLIHYPKNARAELHACTPGRIQPSPSSKPEGFSRTCVLSWRAWRGLASPTELPRTGPPPWRETECFPDWPSSPRQGPVTEPSEITSLAFPSLLEISRFSVTAPREFPPPPVFNDLPKLPPESPIRSP